MGWTQQQFFGTLVLIFGTGNNTGLFVYNGTPSASNPPIFWATSGTQDPFGNTIPSTVGAQTQFLVYTGAPAAGNLICAITPTNFTDTFGNQVFAGFNILTPFVAGQARLLNIAGGSGQNAGILWKFSTVGQNTWQTGASIVTSGTTTVNAAADSFVQTAVTGGVIPSFNTGELVLNSLAATPSTFALGQVFANAHGTVSIVEASQLSGAVPVSQVDVSTHSVGNVATAGDITKTWSIPGGDGAANTIYEIDTFVQFASGATAAETLTIGIDINGTLTPISTLGASFNGSALSTSYDMPVRLRLIVDAVGLNTPLVTLDGPIGDISANRLSTNSANMSGHSGATTFNKANANTIALFAQWGAAGGVGQNVQTLYSELIRKGP